MSVKILGGQARGLSIETPKSIHTRPTSVLLKRRFFDSFQDFTGVAFIDLCAGSGSIGYEALSRGCPELILVENSQPAIKSLKVNLDSISSRINHLNKVDILKIDLTKWLSSANKRVAELKENHTGLVLYFDPPYEKIVLYEQLFSFLRESNFSGKVVVEACAQKTMPISSFESSFGESKKIYKQGTSYLMVYDFL